MRTDTGKIRPVRWNFIQFHVEAQAKEPTSGMTHGRSEARCPTVAPRCELPMSARVERKEGGVRECEREHEHLAAFSHSTIVTAHRINAGPGYGCGGIDAAGLERRCRIGHSEFNFKCRQVLPLPFLIFGEIRQKKRATSSSISERYPTATGGDWRACVCGFIEIQGSHVGQISYMYLRLLRLRR